MKKKKLKTSFHSLLEDSDEILKVELPDDFQEEKEAEPLRSAVSLDSFLERLKKFEPGDLVVGIELMETADSIIKNSTVSKTKAGIIKRIRELLEDNVKNGISENIGKIYSLMDELSGEEKAAKPKSDGNITVVVEDSEIMKSFIQEAKEHLSGIEEKILKYEHDGDREIINDIFRSVHTIKGTSSFLDLDSIKSLSHRLEFLLDNVRKGEMDSSSPLIDLLLEGSDFLGAMVEELSEKFYSAKSSRFDIPAHSAEILELEKKFNAFTTPDPNEDSMSAQPEADDEIYQSFLGESSDLIDEAEQILLLLEKGDALENGIDTVFRNIHTIKGNSGFLGFAAVEESCMEMETKLDIIRSGEKEVAPGNISMLLRMLDKIKKNIASDGNDSPKAIGEILLEEGKIEKSDLEKALDIQEMKVGEILLTEGKISKGDLSKALQKQEKHKRTGSQVAGVNVVERRDIRVDMIKIDKLFNLMGELITAEEIIIHNPEIAKLKNMERSINYLSKITREMQEITMSIRMIPLEGLFNRMRRLVRDLGKKTGKKVELKIFGQDTEMDKNVIEEISDPLVHIIRNSLDHGLEEQLDRIKKGKSETGTITLGAKYEGNEIWIMVSDDGAGLDREKILSKAVSSGLVDANSDDMSDNEVWSLIFAPGFSTADKVTEVSGRGVGMDVVKSNIEKLHGKISVTSMKDKGTDITLKIPLTLAIMDGVTVRVGNIVFALPIGDIREFHKADERQITVAESGREVLKLRQSIIPVVKLAQIYRQSGGTLSVRNGILLIVETNGKRAALLVDEIIGYHQIVVKALPEALKGLSSISGCSIMGNGEVNLIIDSGSLLNEVLL